MLTHKQLTFCHEYLVDMNATQAAIRAGYSAHSAKQMASALIQDNADVQDELARLMREREKRTDLTADAIIEELRGIAFANLDQMMAAGKLGAKVKALELLGKQFGLFNGRMDYPPPAPSQAQQEIAEMSLTELRMFRDFLIEREQGAPPGEGSCDGMAAQNRAPYQRMAVSGENLAGGCLLGCEPSGNERGRRHGK